MAGLQKIFSIGLFLAVVLATKLFAAPTVFNQQFLSTHSTGVYIDSLFSCSLVPFFDTTGEKVDILDSKLPMPEYKKIGQEMKNHYLILDFHFLVDSDVAGVPFALQMVDYGAADVFVDGKLVQKYGRTSIKFYVEFNPQEMPLPLNGFSAGLHTLSIRYLNTHVVEDYNSWGKLQSGVSVKLGLGSTIMAADHTKTVFFTILIFVMVGVFLALAFAHLFIFFYIKIKYADLYFSLFCLSMVLAFMVPYIGKTINDPSFERVLKYLEFSYKVLNGIALTGFINSLFSEKKLRFKVFVGTSIMALILSVIFPPISELVFALNLFAVSIEAIALTIKAIRKKIAGARILGLGLLLFVVFVMIFSVVKIHFGINDADLATHPLGKIFMGLIVCVVMVMPVSMALFLAFQFAHLTRSLTKTNKNLLELISYNAHQIREPLTRITGALIVREYYDDKIEYMDEIFPQLDKAANDLDAALKDVLNKVQEETGTE